jgi:hypothetical protein
MHIYHQPVESDPARLWVRVDFARSINPERNVFLL